ncbi:MAG: hypothetical protein ACXVA6_17655 [Isosphaeraceae bacterium]
MLTAVAITLARKRSPRSSAFSEDPPPVGAFEEQFECVTAEVERALRDPELIREARRRLRKHS